MGIDFEEEVKELPHSEGVEVCLPPKERHEFFEKMKHVVVLLEVEYYETDKKVAQRKNRRRKGKHGKRREKDESPETLWMKGTGVVIDRKGLILTCSHNIPKTFTQIIYGLEVHGDKDKFAKLIERKDEWDLALLRAVEEREFKYAKLGEMLSVGTEAYSIGHSSCMRFTFAVGEIAFPVHRKKGHLIDESPEEDMGPVKKSFKNMVKKLQLVQLNNFHGMAGGSGGPIFDCRGRVIGIYALVLRHVDFAIHLSMVKEFVERFLVPIHDLGPRSAAVLPSHPQANLQPPPPPPPAAAHHCSSAMEREMDVSRISPQERVTLHNTMVQVVVGIRTQIRPSNAAQEDVSGIGVVVHPKGHVLTSALVVPDNHISIYCSRKGVANELEFEVIWRKEREGLAILMPKVAPAGDVDVRWAEFGKEDSLHAGMEVFSITHPSQMEFSFAVGQLTSGCSRTVDEVIKQGRRNSDRGNRFLMNARKNLSLIQLNNLHSTVESFGSPVFNSSGKIIGIHSLVHNFIDYAIHVVELQKFCKGRLPEKIGDSSEQASRGKKRGCQESFSGVKKPK